MARCCGRPVLDIPRPSLLFCTEAYVAWQQTPMLHEQVTGS